MTAPTTRRTTKTDSELIAWAEFRYQIRVWMRSSEQAARALGLSPQHQQVLLAIKGYPEAGAPRVADLAERMQLRHHSMVGLLDRMSENDLVERIPLGGGRGVSVVLTEKGEKVFAEWVRARRPQVRAAAHELIRALTVLVESEPTLTPRKRPAARGTNGRAAH